MYISIVLVTVFTVRSRANLLHECAKLYNPRHYMSHLPSLHLPYIGDVPIPNNIPPIKPSAVVKTKAVKVITSYVYKNPVCIKYTKKKAMCKQDNSIKHKGAYEQLVTKEYFVKDRKSRNNDEINRHKRGFDNSYEERDAIDKRYNQVHLKKAEDVDYHSTYVNNLESSETVTLSKENRKTPELFTNNVNNMLIEDRLDQLETILPHYTRRRTYETSTITVTKVLSNRKTMATLLAKNCIPYGFDLCESKTRKRQSKIAKFSNDSVEERYYFG
ncbi:uncharacterized protein LOC130892320 [Diorhabda carinulata]|uniref:uncharacterized protein LOC130892320 n=1 Tax=Diorhabda carinulata TaxID=1163345 RepID=UPI0025A0B4A8|nr:uncharacterized protein LOC130892320 [Diorhabda carinulata]